METKDFIYDGEEYTLVETYDTNIGTVVELDSDEDVMLLVVDNNLNTRKLTEEEELGFRLSHGLEERDYVPATIKDIIHFHPHCDEVDKNIVNSYKEWLGKRLSSFDVDMKEDSYIKKRIKDLKYRSNADMNVYEYDTVYFTGRMPRDFEDSWIPTHETIHGIVNKSTIPTRGVVEGITDWMVGYLLPQGNYSRVKNLLGKDVQFNKVGLGQDHMVALAKQMGFGLGENFDMYEMLTHPHKQIKTFKEMYGKSNGRVLLHKINKAYVTNSGDKFIEAQEYMLRYIFDKKFKSVDDVESAQMYFNQLIEFGLLRGRINGKDDALKDYYNEKVEELKQKGIDATNIPEYSEKPFDPCANVFFRFDSYVESSIKARKKGEGKEFKIYYNKDNTCVYIIVDGKFHLIQDDSPNNKRRFFKNDMNDKCDIVELENGNYLITGPDGVVEEVRDTYIDEYIDELFEKRERKEGKAK